MDEEYEIKTNVPPEMYDKAVELIDEKGYNIREASEELKIKYGTLYQAIRRGKCNPETIAIKKERKMRIRPTMLYDPINDKVCVRQGNNEIVLYKDEFIDLSFAILDVLEKLDRMKEE